MLKLTALGGYESADLSDLFNWSSRTWLLGPLIGTILIAPIRIAQVRYDTGATSYLDVIEAQRTLLPVQRLDTQIRGSRANSTVALIRAWGGGWDAPTTLSDSGQVH